jgi:predicted Zn-dependent protease
MELRDHVRFYVWAGLLGVLVTALCRVSSMGYRGSGSAILIDRAYAMAERGQYGTAASSLEKALARRPDDADLHDALADLLEAVGRDEEALQHRMAYARQRSDSEAQWKLAQAYVSSAQYERAAEVLRECLRTGGGGEVTYRLLAFCYDRMGLEGPARAARATADGLAKQSGGEPDRGRRVIELKQYM